MVEIVDPRNPTAKEVQVGWHLDGSRLVPVYWPTGRYTEGESGSVGGTWTGYSYVSYRHESGFSDTLKGHQIEALRELGIMRPATS